MLNILSRHLRQVVLCLFLFISVPKGKGGYTVDQGGQTRKGRCTPSAPKRWGGHRSDKQGNQALLAA